MILGKGFYKRPTISVARDLLGKRLVREFENGKRLVGKIVEVEAYLGPEDLAAHSARGRRTKRTEVQYGLKGYVYVYLIYGIYHCLNIVTGPLGKPEVILIRALEPFGVGEGKSQAFKVSSRPGFGESPAEEFAKVASGPGKLCRWMEIDKSFNGWNLTKGKELWVEDWGEERFEVVAAKRIGVDYAGQWAEKEWRFFIRGNKGVSRPVGSRIEGLGGIVPAPSGGICAP